MIRLALAVTALLPLAACGGDALASRAHDPCTLVAAREAEPYVGPLATPPYRASDGAADAGGDQCLYRGRDGRAVTVRPEWSGGQTIGQALKLPGAVMGVLARGAPGLDSLTGKVMKRETGPWDQATWIPGGSLFASSGETQVQVDVSGASGKEADALALARIAMPRFGHPLEYDGAKAVAAAPRPRARPAHACDLVSRADVEAAIGPTDGSPVSDSPETSCTWRVRTAQGQRSYPVEVVWQGGEKNYQMLLHGMSMAGGLSGAPSSSPLDTMKLPPQMQQVMGGLMKMVSGGAEGGGPGSAPGAVATVGVRTDTTLTGPWDRAALLHGTQLIAVRGDAFVGMSLVSADYEKAKALLAAICSRL